MWILWTILVLGSLQGAYAEDTANTSTTVASTVASTAQSQFTSKPISSIPDTTALYTANTSLTELPTNSTAVTPTNQILSTGSSATGPTSSQHIATETTSAQPPRITTISPLDKQSTYTTSILNATYSSILTSPNTRGSDMVSDQNNLNGAARDFITTEAARKNSNTGTTARENLTTSSTAPGSKATSITAPGSKATSTTAPGSKATSTTAPGSKATSSTAPGSQATSSTAPGSQATSSTAPGSQAISTTAPGSQAISTTAPGSQATSTTASRIEQSLTNASEAQETTSTTSTITSTTGGSSHHYTSKTSHTTTPVKTRTTTARKPTTFTKFVAANTAGDKLERDCAKLIKIINAPGNCNMSGHETNGVYKYNSIQLILLEPSEETNNSMESTPKEKQPEDIQTTLIAIVASCGALALILLAFAVYCSYHRISYRKNQQHLTEELQTIENGYHDNPTLEVMEVQPEMQEKKLALNGEFNDSWIVPFDNLAKDDIPDEEDTHL
ncbi:hypothetical protein PHYPO_G00086630 [Pangasianodon hypophthalmus]|uniref:Podocalyxin n=1 Tax=Pangasianodon hypophthalmus TaxID=310915 RepID=A0A5N5LH49_PANHP|nr:hypothetical protein PHYPO_G00086630 [Pangasianodon hypophthalmus]